MTPGPAAVRSPGPALAPGQSLVETARLPAQRLDELFALLLLTMAGVFVLGNLAVLDAAAVRASAKVGLVSAALACVFYVATRRSGSLAGGFLLTFAMLLAATLARSGALDAVVYAVLALAAVDTARTLRARVWPGLLAAAVVAAVVIVACRHAYTSFDMATRLAGGRLHQDPLFHAAIAAMIKNYGVVSTGLHGLVETPYHALSHALMAGISRLAATPVIEVYGVANWLLFAPLLVLATAAAALVLGSAAVPAALPWALAAAVFGIAQRVLEPWGFLESFLVSESYLLSLLLLLLALPLLFLRRLAARHLLLTVLLTLALSFAKVSVGLVFAGLWLVRALFMAEGRRIAAATALLSLACAAWAVLGPSAAMSGRIGLDPLHYLRTYSALGSSLSQAQLALEVGAVIPPRTLVLALAAVGSFAFMHFMPAWFAVAFAARGVGVKRLLQAPIALYCLAAAGVGLLVVALFYIPGGSAYFFSSIAFFVALPALLAQGAAWLAGRDFAPRAWHGLAALALFPLLLEGTDRVLVPWPAAVPTPLPARLAALREAGARDVVLRADAADLADNPIGRCTARPFVFPAVSERPWVGVIEPLPTSKCAYVNYGYALYRLEGELQQVSMPPVLQPGMTVAPYLRNSVAP